MQFYDLKVSIDQDTNVDDLLNCIKAYNYHTIAVNLTLKDSEVFSTVIKNFKNLFQQVFLSCESRNIQCLRRLTFVTGTVFQRQNFKDCTLDWFDLLAIIPTTQDAFNHASHRTDIDIIAFDSCTFSNLKIGRNIDVAINNGIYFELEYSSAIKGGKRAKIFMFEEAYTIIRRCRKQSIIISSGASNANLIRSPQDVINLGIMSGLGINNAVHTLTFNPKSAMYHGYSRERTLFGIFELIPKCLNETLINVEEPEKYLPIHSKTKRKIALIDSSPSKIQK